MASSKTFYDLVRSAPRGRFNGIRRHYTPQDVQKLRGSVEIDYTLATLGANKLWDLLHNESYINALGAMSGNQAMQMVRAGLKAIYLSGWQVAADNNTNGSMYPDQSLYPSNSGPELVKRINKTLSRADQIDFSEGIRETDWFAPIIADAEAGFGGALNCFEIMKAYIEVGASGVHYEDQLSSEKKCGHLGGKVLLPTSAHERNVNAARLAADVCGVPTVLVSRTDAESATLITSAVDERDRAFIDFDRGQTHEGFYFLKPGMGLENCIQRGLAYSPYSDMLWMETSTPDLSIAQAFAEGIRKEYPNILLSYNCSPSFNWEANLSPKEIERFQVELAAMGYKFQFVTLAGFHSLNLGMYKLARGYKESGMKAYSELQQEEFALQSQGYTAVRHQREVGTRYFDLVATAASGGTVSTTASEDSTEEAQFHAPPPVARPGYGPRSRGSPIRIPQAGMSTVVNAAPTKSMPRVYINAPSIAGEDEVIAQDTFQLLQRLHDKFGIRRRYILDQRETLQDRIAFGYRPDFRKETDEIRQDKSWKAKNAPSDLVDRRVEITAPATQDDLSSCLKSGAKAILTDFEDSLVPTWDNLIAGQSALKQAILNRRLGESEPALVCRPRGLHLPESHMMIDGCPMSASFFDMALYLTNNAKTLLRRGTGPYLYLPKIQSFEEAVLWNDILCEIEEHNGLPKDSIRTTVLIEHVLATFQADEIIYALRNRITGLNCGRWDYLFSHMKTFSNDPSLMLPDRTSVTMQSPFMYNYCKFVIKTAHSRGIHAIGSMSPQVPNSEDLASRQAVEDLVRQDKQREFVSGHDGTWVAHPSLIPVAAAVFEDMPPSHHQISYIPADVDPETSDLINVPTGTLSEACLRRNVRTALAYYASWFQEKGWNNIDGVMEEAAGAEVSRAQVWQWLHHKAELKDGQRTTVSLVDRVVAEEAERLKSSQSADTLDASKELLLDSLHATEMPNFMTYDAYCHLVQNEF